MTAICSICGRRFTPKNYRTVAPDNPACSTPACRKALAKRNLSPREATSKHDYPDPVYVEDRGGIWVRV